MKIIIISLAVIFLASCTPLPDWGTPSKPRESASPAKYSYKYIFNEPRLARDKEEKTPCGLTGADFRAYVEERIKPEWEVIEVRYVWGNKQAGPRCLSYAIVKYNER